MELVIDPHWEIRTKRAKIEIRGNKDSPHWGQLMDGVKNHEQTHQFKAAKFDLNFSGRISSMGNRKVGTEYASNLFVCVVNLAEK